MITHTRPLGSNKAELGGLLAPQNKQQLKKQPEVVRYLKERSNAYIKDIAHANLCFDPPRAARSPSVITPVQ